MEQKIRRDRNMGDNLRRLRNDAGLSQEKLCAELQRRGCDIGRTTYAKYEAKRKPELDVIIQLAALYGVSVEIFLGDYPEKAINPRNLKTYAKASTPEVKDGNGLSRDELNLLSLFRNSIRKADILTYARKIAMEDSKVSDKLNND